MNEGGGMDVASCQKQWLGFAPWFSSHGRFGERGAPVLTLSSVEPEDRNVKIRGIPHLAKNERDMGHPPIRGRDKS
jgi:hypothetical protein